MVMVVRWLGNSNAHEVGEELQRAAWRRFEAGMTDENDYGTYWKPHRLNHGALGITSRSAIGTNHQTDPRPPKRIFQTAARRTLR